MTTRSPSRPPRRTDLPLRVFREVAIIDDHSRDRLQAALPEDLPPAQYGVLSHLWFTSNRDECVRDLAQVFRVTPSAMTQMVTRLRTRALVALTPHPTDRRVKVVSLTAAGRGLVETTFSALADELAPLAARFDVAGLTDLLDRLRGLRDAVEARSNPEPGAQAS